MKLDELYKKIKERKKKMPEGSFTASLFKDGEDRIIQKVGEEAVELLIAAKGKVKKRVIEESADLLFVYLILLVQKNILLSEIFAELERREKKRYRSIDKS